MEVVAELLKLEATVDAATKVRRLQSGRSVAHSEAALRNWRSLRTRIYSLPWSGDTNLFHRTQIYSKQRERAHFLSCLIDK